MGTDSVTPVWDLPGQGPVDKCLSERLLVLQGREISCVVP